MSEEVIVVGAGPVGLLLAGMLAGEGVGVTVFEQELSPSTQSRASTLHAASMATLSELGLLERLGPLHRGGAGHFGGMPLHLEAAQPDHPFAGQWKCPQPHLVAVLTEWARERGVRLLRGCRVTGLKPGRDSVDVVFTRIPGETESLQAGYVVGCDGEDSAVRRLGAFAVDTQVPGLEMLRADIGGISIPERRFERHPNGLATAHRWPDGSTRVMVHVFGTPAGRSGLGGPVRPPSHEEIADAWAKVTGEDIGGGQTIWLNAFDDRSLQAREYVRGRVLLAGDAAHVQMPVGGQALNLGLADAWDLAPRLAEAVRVGGSGPLQEYQRLRHLAGARALVGIRAQARLLLGGPDVEPLRAVIGDLLGIDEVARRVARSIAGLARERAH